MPELTVICWRDVPAQVTSGSGRSAVRALLPGRFQDAIDAAAMAAGLSGTDAYLEQWRRETRPCGDDVVAEVAAERARIGREYTDEVLARLVRAQGLKGDTNT